MYKVILSTILFFAALSIFGQVNTVEGYVYEDGNRGFLNQVKVEIIDKATGISVYSGESNAEGYFEATVQSGKDYMVNASKQLFKKKTIDFTSDAGDKEKKFVKIKMVREPGYDFEVTLAPKRDSEDIPVDAIRGAWIEVYNNTTKEEVLNLKEHEDMEFNVHFDQGNHYTIMVRKDGFLTKRMEAYVNIEGCILCFDGVGSVQPGVTDNLSDKNSMGVLLANVEMEPLFNGKTFTVENIYYDFGKATLRAEAKKSLKNLALVITDNPQIKIELGSHTDARGETADNQLLSQKRAKAAVTYLVDELSVSPSQIISAGYGESILKNECTDGVKCTEKQHQENRRTEVRVLNIDKSKKNLKSLAEIRVEEDFLKSLFDGEQETKIGDTPPTDDIEVPSVKKNIDNKPDEKAEAMRIAEMEFKAQEKRKQAEAEKASIDKKARMEAEKMAEEMKMAEMEYKAQEERKKAEAEQAKLEEMARLEAKKEEEAMKKVAEMEIKAQEEKRQAAAAAAAELARLEEERLKKEAVAVEGKRKEVPVFVGKVDAVERQPTIGTEEAKPEFGNPVTQRTRYEEIQLAKDPMFNYTGYKIVIQFSKDPISQDSDIYKRHDDLVEYNSKSGSILYMIGDFNSEEKADKFLVKTVSQIYPGAYIVQFKNGNRLN